MYIIKLIKAVIVGVWRFVLDTPAHIRSIPYFLYRVRMVGVFFILLMSFLAERFTHIFLHIPIIKYPTAGFLKAWNVILGRRLEALLAYFDAHGGGTVSRMYLIKLGYMNLMAKRTRSFVTISGMSVGIGVIVLLLSLGYGVERLIISRVASLEELKMIDVVTGENTALRLNQKAYDKIKKIEGVKEIVPLVSIVGRITYKRASTDVLVYGAPRSYLNHSKMRLKKGSLYASDILDIPTADVAGASVELPQAGYSTLIDGKDVVFDLIPEAEIPLREECDVRSEIVGMGGRLMGGYTGFRVWGSSYESSDSRYFAFDKVQGVQLGRWIKAELPLFDASGEGRLQERVDKQGRQIYKVVCLPEKYTQRLDEYAFSEVLGEATQSATTVTTEVISADALTSASPSGGLEFVQMQATGSATVGKTQKKLEFSSPPSASMLVSTGLLSLLNIPESKAVGTKIAISFIVTKSLLPEVDGKAFAREQEYTVSGVIDDASNQYIYVPFADMQKLGLKNFSQMKVVIGESADIAKVRKQIETFGFKTTSTVDTVKQIESLFNSLRIVLVLIGMVALGVAALGMFNTLTVSLLERTREIGGMKTMGMVSSEVEDLFLAEAMIMGLSGGVGGIVLGFVAGKTLSFVVSMIALTQGQGYLELAYIPSFLIFFILLFSFVVGVVTGVYPAVRAKKISALNALRYE